MTATYKILVIDDDEVDRMAICRALKKSGASDEIDEVASGREGIKRAQEKVFDCIFLDYLLPDYDGLGILANLREAGVDTPVVMLTGQGNEKLAVDLMKAGAADYLTKGELTPDVIFRSIQHVLRVHNAELERRKSERGLRELNKKLSETQNQLLQSEKMASIGQLAAGVAHEINNPVGYINSNLNSLKKYTMDVFHIVDAYELVQQQTKTDSQFDPVDALKKELDLDFIREDMEGLFSESEEGISRVKRIVDDLKDFSHVGESEWQWSNIHNGLDSTLNVVINEIKYKAEVLKEYGDLPDVECLSSQLNQVFMNLLVNAAHAIETRGVITIRTDKTDNEWVCVTIEDNGKGISEENLSKIFDPFFTTKPIGSGTGLGLSLSYGIIEKHKGRIEVESTLNKGTCFKIWLPIQQSVAQADNSTQG